MSPQTWRPLGYNIRPRRLQSIAQQAVEKYDGRLPSDRETLLSFKGIGAYTAGAIRSFAFREREAILDTNVARVLYRVFIGKGDPKSHAMKKRLWALSSAVLPHKHVFDFNQALMDFGATHCSARKPKCGSCSMKGLLLVGYESKLISSRSASGNGNCVSSRLCTQRICCPIIGFGSPRSAQR